MMENMQGMMGGGGMMGRQGMRGMGRMTGRQGMGMMPQEEEDDEEEAPQRRMMGRRGMMGRGGMMGRHLERLAQQLELTDEQQTQARTLLRNHAKEAIRLRADRGVMTIDVQQLLDTDPVDVQKAKQLVQDIAMKDAALHLAHITLMQDVNKLLSPEQQKKFRTMRESMFGMGGMMGHGRMMGHGGMMGPGGMMGRGRGEQ
jgi:Spy/CpxP family protein refolding chaperone